MIRWAKSARPALATTCTARPAAGFWGRGATPRPSFVFCVSEDQGEAVAVAVAVVFGAGVVVGLTRSSVVSGAVLSTAVVSGEFVRSVLGAGVELGG